MSGAERLRAWRGDVLGRVRRGARFAGLFATARGEWVTLTALLAEGEVVGLWDVDVPAGGTYLTLSSELPAASWYEREIHDLVGLTASGRPRLDPLLLPGEPDATRPAPAGSASPPRLDVAAGALPVHVAGPGVFTIPLGPVRSGVFEAVEYLNEGPGEDIQHVRPRVYVKHRGVEKRFEQLDVTGGVLLAERVEGVASVAHALAYAGAVERLAGVAVPSAAALVRVLYAELERVGNHLMSVQNLCEAAGLAVALARFGYQRERVLRLLGAASGSRFGRGVVTVGGVHALPALGAAELLAAFTRLERSIVADARLLMGTSSFLDRLRFTGVIEADTARSYGALGPVGRASGLVEDVRVERPYAGYDRLGAPTAQVTATGDALARTRQRLAEIGDAFRLARAAVDALDERADLQEELSVPVPADLTGRAVGWAEAPHGEVLYLVQADAGRLVRVKPRSASFHNFMLFGPAFRGDITTDFAFIEASFNVSIAGVAG